MTRMCWRMVNGLVLAAWLLAGTAAPQTAVAKGYSSGGGSHSYSSHSSSGGSHSYSSSSHSYSSGSSSRSSSSGSSKSVSSGSRSYSSGSSSSGNSQRGYSSGKSYGAGAASDKLFSSKPPSRDSSKSSSSSSSTRSKSSGSDSSFSFDTAAARAQKEQTSKSDYTKYKESKTPPVLPSDNRSTASRPQTAPSSGGSSSTGTWRDRDNWGYPRRAYVYVPDVMVIRTRPARIYNVFGGYTYRPWVTYSDPFSSLFWWWLLDRSLDDQAWWAYHHRYDMDPARYQALLANNQQLEARVAQLEAQQSVPRDPAYTPTGLDRDLMYSDHYVAQAYNNRPTRGGSVAFWVFGVPLAGGFCVFLIWLIWFKRWQTAT